MQTPVVVIGSGPAGAAAALFLGRAGVDTLVLETGSSSARLGFTARFRGLTLARYKPPLHERRGLTRVGDPKAQLFEARGLGGLSNHWSCAVPRFSPDDFDDARRGGEAHTWPIDYHELVPWYDRVEPLLHIAGAAEDARALPAGRIKKALRLGQAWQAVRHHVERRGRDLVVMPYAFGGQTTVTPAGTAFNAYSRLLRPAERERIVRVRCEARAVRLEWSPRERRVTAVICVHPGTGAVERIPCRAVVLAAGAVGSAQILLQSASADFPTGLGNDRDLVGRYLHDHPLGKLVVEVRRPVRVHPATYLTRPSLSHAPALYAAACMQWSGTAAWLKSWMTGRPGRVRTLGFSVFGTMEPTADDFVALDASKPRRSGEADLILSLRHPPEARRCLEAARADLIDALTEAGWEPRVRSWTIEPPGNSVHYGGTCRMHVSPKLGVVDAFSRLHAVRNVAVADSSVFTTGPEKNPVLTAMALAARAGDRLAQELRQGDL